MITWLNKHQVVMSNWKSLAGVFNFVVMSWKNNLNLSLRQFTNILIFFSPHFIYTLLSVNLKEFKNTEIYGDETHIDTQTRAHDALYLPFKKNWVIWLL